LEITWLGHAAVLIKGIDTIMVDPFFIDNPSTDMTPDQIVCDMVCVTHGHSDHVGDAVSISKRNHAPILSIVELSSFFDKASCQTVGFNIGGSTIVKSTKVTMVPAVHSCGADANGLEGAAGSPAGFVIESGQTVYHAGDTALFGDMALIGELHPIDVALLPIDGFFTMDAIHAAKAVELLKPRIAIPIHYEAVGPMKADPKVFKSEVEKRCKTEVRILDPGQSLTVEAGGRRHARDPHS
jgi:L-ascorbate metabolism protein UlaG (beta-lactamase superfamily)